MEWFRWYHGTVNDPKFTVVARIAQQPKIAVLAVWSAILEHCSQAEERGSLESLDHEDIAASLDMDTEDIVTICHALSQKKLIDAQTVLNFKKRQPKREDETATDRKRGQREREKLQAQLSELQRKLEAVTQSHAESRTVTESHARAEQSRTEKNRAEQSRAGSTSEGGLKEESAEAADPKPGGEEKPAEVPPPERMTVSEVLELKRNTLSLVDNPGQVTVLQGMVEVYTPEAIREAFQAAKDKRVKNLNWVLARLRERDSNRGKTGGLDAATVEEQNRQAVRDFCGVGGAA